MIFYRLCPSPGGIERSDGAGQGPADQPKFENFQGRALRVQGGVEIGKDVLLHQIYVILQKCLKFAQFRLRQRCRWGPYAIAIIILDFRAADFYLFCRFMEIFDRAGLHTSMESERIGLLPRHDGPLIRRFRFLRRRCLPLRTHLLLQPLADQLPQALLLQQGVQLPLDILALLEFFLSPDFDGAFLFFTKILLHLQQNLILHRHLRIHICKQLYGSATTKPHLHRRFHIRSWTCSSYSSGGCGARAGRHRRC